MTSPQRDTERGAWNEVIPIVTQFLSRIYSLKHPFTVKSGVSVSILNAVTFEPKLYRLLLSSDCRIEWISEKLQPVRAVKIRLFKQSDFFTVEFYEDARTRLAVIFHHKDDRITLIHVFTDFVADGAEDITPVGAPVIDAPRLTTVVIHVLEALRAGRQIGSDGPTADGDKLASVSGSTTMLPPAKQEPEKSEKPSTPEDERIRRDSHGSHTR